nr:OsmC family protein [uncultured Flavobacterium sp.]
MAKVTANIEKNTYKTILQGDTKTFLADEPADLGGTNLGPTPLELLASSLAACTAITVRMYANRKQWPLEDIVVDVELDTESKPGTTLFKKKIEIIGDELDDKMRERILNIAEKCPVNKILQQPIEMVK